MANYCSTRILVAVDVFFIPNFHDGVESCSDPIVSLSPVSPEENAEGGDVIVKDAVDIESNIGDTMVCRDILRLLIIKDFRYLISFFISEID
ncbi:259_t:CDS:2 [Entrophospora sp. SA101]|nr:259_t:CDS:2 [Entrophospora sp. SA101]